MDLELECGVVSLDGGFDLCNVRVLKRRVEEREL